MINTPLYSIFDSVIRKSQSKEIRLRGEAISSKDFSGNNIHSCVRKRIKRKKGIKLNSQDACSKKQIGQFRGHLQGIHLNGEHDIVILSSVTQCSKNAKKVSEFDNFGILNSFRR